MSDHQSDKSDSAAERIAADVMRLYSASPDPHIIWMPQDVIEELEAEQ